MGLAVPFQLVLPSLLFEPQATIKCRFSANVLRFNNFSLLRSSFVVHNGAACEKGERAALRRHKPYSISTLREVSLRWVPQSVGFPKALGPLF